MLSEYYMSRNYIEKSSRKRYHKYDGIIPRGILMSDQSLEKIMQAQRAAFNANPNSSWGGA